MMPGLQATRANDDTVQCERAEHQPLADTTHDDVVLVDADDREIGVMQKLEAHRLGRSHRAISVFVRDGGGRLLLQRRAAGKYHSAGLWSNTCCSHPRPGEHALCAAVRRLREEMGVVAQLSPLFSTHYRALVAEGLIEDEIVHVFGGISRQMPDPDAAEVADWCWKTLDEIENDVRERPQAYTIWFRQFLDEFEPEIARFVSA
jgi:isopentenyl-diphosphate delta-isomerase